MGDLRVVVLVGSCPSGDLGVCSPSEDLGVVVLVGTWELLS